MESATKYETESIHEEKKPNFFKELVEKCPSEFEKFKLETLIQDLNLRNSRIKSLLNELSDVQKSMAIQAWDIESLIDDISSKINPGNVARLIVEAEKTENKYSQIQEDLSRSKVRISALISE